MSDDQEFYRRELSREHLPSWKSRDGERDIPRPARITLRWGKTQQEATPDHWVRFYVLSEGGDPEAFEDMRLVGIFYPDGMKHDLYTVTLLYPSDALIVMQSTTEDYKATISGAR